MSPSNEAPILMDTDVTVLLFVQDPEQEEVTFFWSVSGLGWQGTAEPVQTGGEAEGLYASQITLPVELDFGERSTLFCDFWDGVSDHQQVSWELEALL